MMASEPVMIGETLDGKYRVDRQLGSGGMGNVYLATHLGTTRVVAVKVIAPRWAADPHFVARFQREAQACGRLRHPNIVNVTDFGISRTRSGDVPYLVMELLDGQSLSAWQKAHPKPALPLVADLLDQIGLALAEAHRHGIVHRDLKPDNIWLEPNGRGGYTVKVLDFGVAKLNLPEIHVPPVSGEFTSGTLTPESMETALMSPPPISGPAVNPDPAGQTETIAVAAVATPPSSGAFGSDGGQTMPGSLIGTPAFMSPEQALGKEVDYRSDIYSLAVIAYGLVCGRLPYVAGSPRDLIRYHQRGPQAPASIQKTPGDVSDAILAGMAISPDDRPESAVAFTRRFRNAVDAEFLALRRSRAFLLQHLATFALLLLPLHGILVAVSALLGGLSKKLLPALSLRMVFITIVGGALFVFAGNLLRAAAALIALDEQERVRSFVGPRVLLRLTKALPVLFRTQVRAWFSTGPGWITGDCLWPVVCVVEGLSEKRAIQRSRELMTGLRSAGRALAIRHLALPVFALSDVLQYVLSLGRILESDDSTIVLKALWFPLMTLFAAAPLFLYDRTAARESGPLLQLDRTPEVPITARPFSISSTVWVAALLLYVLYPPFRGWLFGR